MSNQKNLDGYGNSFKHMSIENNNMVTIYCIEDINDLKYIGSTKNKLNVRLSEHRTHRTCSSKKLNLNNSIIYSLENCDECDRNEREKYWINKIDCVNELKYNGRDKLKSKERRKKHYKEKVIKKCIDDIIKQIELLK